MQGFVLYMYVCLELMIWVLIVMQGDDLIDVFVVFYRCVFGVWIVDVVWDIDLYVGYCVFYFV